MSENTVIPPTPSDTEYSEEDQRSLIPPVIDPIQLFTRWLADASDSEPNDPNAMSLATVDEHGFPDVRIILLKDISEGGFSFYTHETSVKGQHLIDRKVGALCFHWKSLRRQVRVRGDVTRVTDTEADAYFAMRARISQLGAWASDQSNRLEDRTLLQSKLEDVTKKFENMEDIPRPPTWGGFLLVPRQIEFWQDQPYRLHDRVLYSKSNDVWDNSRLYP
ncbi:MAG: pyridoxamine 5'-phosphate oxidase [Pseudomonadota bacterium]